MVGGWERKAWGWEEEEWAHNMFNKMRDKRVFYPIILSLSSLFGQFDFFIFFIVQFDLLLFISQNETIYICLNETIYCLLK